jgi:hypothetical protein
MAKVTNQFSDSSMYCNHANEMPAVCPCEPECYCRVHGNCQYRSAAGLEIPSPPDVPVALPDPYAKVRFCIPPVGPVVLAADWSFDLFYSHRSMDLIDSIGLRKKVFPSGSTSKYSYNYQWAPEVDPQIKYGDLVSKVTIPRGRTLSITRFNVSASSSNNSVTIRLMSNSKRKELPKGRFSAMLCDVNNIVCYPLGGESEKVYTNLRGERFLNVGEPLDE